MTCLALTRSSAAGIGIALLVMLAGCSGLRSDAAADRIYVLKVAQPAAPATAIVPGMLVVQRPAVQPGLETDRIALTRPGNELDFYAASRWGGSLPVVLGAFAVQSLAGSFATVAGAERGAGAGDFELLLTARHFEAEYAQGGAPVVRVALDCLLVAAAPRRVIGGCDVDVREPAADNRMGAIVVAFEQAAQRALQEVRVKVVAAASAASAPR